MKFSLMKKMVFFPVLFVTGTFTHAQQQRFDIVTYTVPKNWKVEASNSYQMYSKIDGGSWAQIAIYKSTASKGSIEADSKSEWQTLVTSERAVSQQEETKQAAVNGWSVMSRSGVWVYNGANVATILTTYSNNKVCISILCNATAQPYLKDYQNFIGTVTLKASQANNTSKEENPVTESTQAIQRESSNPIPLHQLSTQWDDGWVSSIKENWTEVAKPSVKLFIFHPDQRTDAYNSDKLKGDKNAWNVLVAPYFSGISSLIDRGMQSYPSITFLTADAIDKQTGKKSHLVFYKKHDDGGSGRYMLVIADNKAAFENEFGKNYINTSSWETLEQSKSWDKLANMQWRNRFSLTPSSLTGKWSSGNSSTLSYYYVNSGRYAGATAVSVSDMFTFLANNKYESDHAGASGVVGNQQFSRQQYKGNYVLNSWKMKLTNRFQGETEEYDSYFEAVKGGLVLVLRDKQGTTKLLVKETAASGQPADLADNKSDIKSNAISSGSSTNTKLFSIEGLWTDYGLETTGVIMNGMPQYTAGYLRKEYDFKSDGTYVFRNKQWLTKAKDILFIYETGTYKVSGNQLVITPKNGKSGFWEKKASSTAWGKFINYNNYKLEKVTYRLEIIEDPNYSNTIVLKPGQPTQRDGGKFNAAGDPYTFRYSFRKQESLIGNPPGFKTEL